MSNANETNAKLVVCFTPKGVGPHTTIGELQQHVINATRGYRPQGKLCLRYHPEDQCNHGIFSRDPALQNIMAENLAGQSSLCLTLARTE